MSERNRAASARTPQWKPADEHTVLHCVNCGTEIVVESLDVEMRCPQCNMTDWVLAQPNAGERMQMSPPKSATTRHSQRRKTVSES